MTYRRNWLCATVFILGAVALGSLLKDPAPSGASADARPVGKTPDKPGAMAALAGTPSCSASRCHGGIEPRDSATSQNNEWTLWHERDPHTRAYAVLLQDRSLRMGRNLGLDKPHEAALCLACHTNPLAAELPTAPDAAALVHAERRFGVGCESCHGGAGGWLVDHTLPGWAKLTPQQKLERGMTPREDMSGMFEQCAACHIGAPKDSIHPVRDVTHDLYAAGHPPLHFEPSTFLANLPPHWKEDRFKKSIPEGQKWALGQVVAARASLKLSEDRLQRKSEPYRPSWPELGEFSCYACHHQLEPDSWRQKRDEDAADSGKKLTAGRVPWREWQWVGPKLLADPAVPGEKDFVTSLDALVQGMHLAPGRSGEAFKKHHVVVAGGLDLLQERIEKSWGAEQSRAVFAAIAKGSPQSWEQAEQLYLACLALNQDLKLKAVAVAVRELEPARAFKAGDSPLGFQPFLFFEKLKKPFTP